MLRRAQRLSHLRRCLSSMSGFQKQITLPHTEPLELYHNVLSGCSGKVRVCLAEKGVSYKSNHIHLIETGWYQTCSPEFKKINPAATVPVLVHQGHPVYESHAQIKYVDEQFEGPSLTPPELKEQIDQWVDFTSLACTHDFGQQDTDARLGCCLPGLSMPLFVAMIQEIPYSKILWGLLHHPDKLRPILFSMMKMIGPSVIQKIGKMSQMTADARESARRHLQNLEEETLADDRAYLLGKDFTLADVGIVTILERMDMAGFSHLYEDLPRVKSYWSRIKARPSYKIAITDEELPIIARGRDRIIKWKEERPDWKQSVYNI